MHAWAPAAVQRPGDRGYREAFAGRDRARLLTRFTSKDLRDYAPAGWAGDAAYREYRAFARKSPGRVPRYGLATKQWTIPQVIQLFEASAASVGEAVGDIMRICTRVSADRVRRGIQPRRLRAAKIRLAFKWATRLKWATPQRIASCGPRRRVDRRAVVMWSGRTGRNAATASGQAALDASAQRTAPVSGGSASTSPKPAAVNPSSVTRKGYPTMSRRTSPAKADPRRWRPISESRSARPHDSRCSGDT